MGKKNITSENPREFLIHSVLASKNEKGGPWCNSERIPRIRIWPLVILESGGWHDRNIVEVSLPFSFERSWICMTRWVPAQKFTALTVWRFEDRKRGLTIPVDIIGTDSPRGTTLRLEIGRIVRPCFQNVTEMLSSGFLRYYLLESSVLSNEAPHHGG